MSEERLELERARAELAAALEREAVLLEVYDAIASSLTRDALMRSTAGALRRVVPFDRAAMTLWSDADQGLRIVALEGPLPPQRFGVGVTVNLDDSHVGWSFKNQKTLLRGDLASERSYTPERRLYDEGIRSMCTAPIVRLGKSLGTITVGSVVPTQYGEKDEALLAALGKLVALAVSNIQAYEEIESLRARLQAENQYLKEEIRTEHDHSEMIGTSPRWREVLANLEQVAATDSTVLVSGETGTGKELIARAIHERSARRDRPLVKVNCGAISAGLVESELFGHVKGAFTGALAGREGRFALAHQGTIFLDEVGELPLETQVKLLRVLQEQEFEPLGSSTTVRVDVRVVAATNRDLQAAVAAGSFREDLYYRLAVVPIDVPPLRERAGDVRLLAAFFTEKLARKLGRAARTIPDEVMERLVAYTWPGNVRELQNVIERAVVLSRGPTLVLPDGFGGGAPARAERTSALTLEELERRHIESVLKEKLWTIEGEGGAAKVLGLHPNTLRSRMQRLGLKRP